ncbi:MAG: hypothetical protein QOF09_3014, partial [Alphaproteobacteria bacterium]|nr:hypothetical protein [Alphaproteobacteria bacterium]
KIAAMAAEGERDPQKLFEGVLAELKDGGGRKSRP